MTFADVPVSALLAAIAVLTALSAYFSSSETAMMALNRYRLRHLVKEKHSGARKANRLLRRPDRLLGVILIGNNLVNFTAATVATVIGMRLFGDTGVLLAPWVLTIVFLIFAEISPKTLAAAKPEPIAFTSAHILTPLLRVLYPVVAFVNAISNFLLRPFVRPGLSNDQLTTEELRTVVGEGTQLPGQHQNMMLSILDLDDVTVNDIMVPRAEIVAIDIDDDLTEIMHQISNSQHTRLPIYKDTINNVLGVLHLRRLSRFVGATELNKAELLSLSREPYFIPEATPLHTQLLNFQSNKRRLALVVDEYGDVQGIVALEDILEEIVGEFTTDYAANVPEIHPQDDGSYLVDGGALLRDINRTLDWTLPVDGPKTLNGLLLEQLEMIPESNVCCRLEDYLMETVHIGNNMIRTVRVWEAEPELTDG